MSPLHIKQRIDSCIRKSIQEIEPILITLLDELTTCVLQSYGNSREVMQYATSQLERIHEFAIPIMMSTVLNQVDQLTHRFEKFREGYNAYVTADWQETDIKSVFQKLGPCLKGKINIAVPNVEMANRLTQDERHKMASFIVDSIQRYGVTSQWDKETFENHQLYFWILYSICKVDGQLIWFFYFSGNFIERLATSQQYQIARDMAENMLMIGHNESMEGEAYFCAARTYTILNQPLAGLLYMVIALRKWLLQDGTIPYKEAFEMLWQIVKLSRGIGFASEYHLMPIVKVVNLLNPPSYDVMSFYHTYFSLMIFAKKNNLLNDIADFLDSHREAYFQDLDHGAMPWITLLAAVKLNFPSADTTRFEQYVNAAKQVVDYKSNALYIDILEHKHEAEHLRELMMRLETTRNVWDYSHDNLLAMLYARMTIDKAMLDNNPSLYLLAMYIRADFTFVKQSIRQNGLYAKSEFFDIDGKEYHLPIENTEVLENLMQQGEGNEVLWIGKGQRNLYAMSLLNGKFSFSELHSMEKQNVVTTQSQIISKLMYERDVKKPGQPIYIKDKNELKQEAESLRDKLSAFHIPVSTDAERLLIAKDMDVAAYPHQLFVDINRNEFVGGLLPSCNIISTEVFIKTNFEKPLSQNFSCAYWTPLNSQEFTFDMIKAQLEDTLTLYNFVSNDSTNPLSPINAEINVVCAHGGVDISNTSWFYADGKPIIETDKIIGKGKLLILFVCHSGSINRPDFDNAMHTLVKRYIRMGYSSVIAPMWSLNTEILPLWLKSFMEFIQHGCFVIDALFKANMAVKEEYVSPEVYACLHLFGNPFLQIADKPVLSVIRK